MAETKTRKQIRRDTNRASVNETFSNDEAKRLMLLHYDIDEFIESLELDPVRSLTDQLKYDTLSNASKLIWHAAMNLEYPNGKARRGGN